MVEKEYRLEKGTDAFSNLLDNISAK